MITAPFTRLPRKKYDQDKDKVIRVDIEYLKQSQSRSITNNSNSNYNYSENDDRSERLSSSSSSNSYDSNSLSESYSSYSSYSHDDNEEFKSTLESISSYNYNNNEDDDENNHDNLSEIEKMSSISGFSTNPKKKENKTISKAFKNFMRKRRLYVLFQLWRKRKAEERRNPMLIHLEKKAVEYKTQVYEGIKKELEEDEKAVRKHAKKLADIQRTIARRQQARLQKDLKFENDKKRRKKEFAKLEYNVFHMQLWAKEDQERAERERLAEKQRQEIEQEMKIMAEKERLKKEYEINDLKLLNNDIAETQSLNQMMRRAGVRPGVNAKSHQIIPEEKLETIRVLYFKLNDDYNFNWKLKSQIIPTDVTPFDVDLKLYRDVEVLIGSNIGERGVLALAGEFVRGACSNITTLDLSRCQIHSRGFSRLLHGLRIGRVINLQALKLRGNSLTSSSMDYLRAAFHTNTFRNLHELDLRENELGDEGAEKIAQMIIADCFSIIRHISLQRNSITDLGVTQIVTVLKAVITKKCPNLSQINLHENNVTTRCKIGLKPLPFGVSI